MQSIVHFEIPADDTARAQAFYQGLFGWDFLPIPEMNYTMVHTAETDEKGMLVKPGAINGGLMKRTSPGETPVLVIDVPSVDEYVAKVGAAGGKVVAPKMSVGDMGYYARVTDTEGNVIGLWETVKKA